MFDFDRVHCASIGLFLERNWCGCPKTGPLICAPQKPLVREMKEADIAGKKTVARKKKAVRSTAKLTTLDDFLGEEGKRDEFETIAV
ncbi:hypothetical protein [Bradyrhizobium guangdongense]|uniref:hypothetical protein n=1 Tax=Bradyrhizobium guangdongense TaxID=1325090 RepID=UPI001FDA8C39|nr:hypothetical protein [Bradyrhizobium guangdongense]